MLYVILVAGVTHTCTIYFNLTSYILHLILLNDFINTHLHPLNCSIPRFIQHVADTTHQQCFVRIEIQTPTKQQAHE